MRIARDQSNGTDRGPVAVIDVGSTSLRMALAQAGPGGTVRVLETLSQELSLGADTFTKGYIELATIEQCVAALKRFTRLLREYRIEPPRLRAIATSAVREAANGTAFIDRIFSATGIDVEVIDDSEVNRYSYLGILPFLRTGTPLKNSTTVVIEVGGGTSQMLVVHDERIVVSQSYRFGTFRLRESLETYSGYETHYLDVMENRIQRTVKEARRSVSRSEKAAMLCMGGDARFAAVHLDPQWDQAGPARVSVRSLNRFTEKILALPVDDLVRAYRLPYHDAETVGSALLTYVRMARALKLSHVMVAPTTIREGILMEMLGGRTCVPAVERQIDNSALELGARFGFDRTHSEHVAALCSRLFDYLREDHGLDARYAFLLRIAALLHDIGLYVSNRSHHKHSMYLIRNSTLFGLRHRELELISLTVRYHRKAVPRTSHAEYMALNRFERIAVAKMAAILRVADALDCCNVQRVRDPEFSREEGRMFISVRNVADLTLEHLALQQKGPLFQQVYGMETVLRKIEQRGR